MGSNGPVLALSLSRSTVVDIGDDIRLVFRKSERLGQYRIYIQAPGREVNRMEVPEGNPDLFDRGVVCKRKQRSNLKSSPA